MASSSFGPARAEGEEPMAPVEAVAAQAAPAKEAAAAVDDRIDHPLFVDEVLRLQFVEHALELPRLVFMRAEFSLQLGP